MESLSSNTEERELQQMRLEERILHPNCMAWFKELKYILKLSIITCFLGGRHKRPYEISFRILFKEKQHFKEKMYHNLNQLQWQLERENLHSCDPKTYLDVLRPRLMEFFDTKEVTDIREKEKNEAKMTKASTRTERA
ncbi:hypothetical protein Tco_0673084 [Tanacetum coccineum]